MVVMELLLQISEKQIEINMTGTPCAEFRALSHAMLFVMPERLTNSYLSLLGIYQKNTLITQIIIAISYLFIYPSLYSAAQPVSQI